MKVPIRPLSFTTKMLILILIILVFTTLSFMLLTQNEVNKVMWNTISSSIRDMRTLISLFVENEYRGLMFHKKYALNKYKDQLKNVTGIVTSNIEYYYSLYKKGLLSENDAKAFALDMVENLRYGNNDYFYIYDANLVAVSHPDPDIRGKNMTEYQDVKGNFPLKMIKNKIIEKGQGFESFWHMHLDETKPVEKLTYNYYFKPWDWIIGTGVYIDDIDKDTETKLVEMVSELRKIFSKIRIGRNGYFFIFDNNHVILVHPTMEGVDFADVDVPGLGIEHWYNLVDASKTPDQAYTYLWDKPDDEGAFKYKKRAYVDFFEPLDWYVVSALYEDEMKEPSRRIFQKELFIALAALLIASLITVFAIRRFTKPVKILTDHARKLTENNFQAEKSDELAHLTEFSHDEMGALAQTFINMEHTLKDYITNLKATTAEKEKIQSELRIAHDIQMSMIPKQFPAFPDCEEIEIYAFIEPAKEVGGDLYDFFFIDQDHLCFLIGDVSDKGVPAALFMARSLSMIRSTVRLMNKASNEIPLPSDVISEVNNELFQNNQHCMFLTILLGILDVKSGNVKLTNAGHNHPYLIKEKSIAPILLPTSPPLGIRPKTKYQTEQITLEHFQSIFLYTDGITEAVNENDVLFGEEKLEKTLRIIPDAEPIQVIKSITKEVHEFAANKPQFDDITMLDIRFLGKQI